MDRLLYIQRRMYDNAVECATMNVNIQWHCRVINYKDNKICYRVPLITTDR